MFRQHVCLFAPGDQRSPASWPLCSQELLRDHPAHIALAHTPDGQDRNALGYEVERGGETLGNSELGHLRLRVGVCACCVRIPSENRAKAGLEMLSFAVKYCGEGT